MKNWFEFQKRLYHRLRRELPSFEARKSKSLRDYEKAYFQDQKKLEGSQWKVFERALNQHKAVFWGDFHPLKQSQRFLLRHLRNPKIRSPKSLAFEAFPSKLNRLVNQYAKKPSEKKKKELQEQLQIEKSLGSSSQIYFEIFEEAGSQAIPIYGIQSSRRSLHARDREMAKSLLPLQQGFWALVGEFHVARPHLPREFSELRPEISFLCIQQNDDRLAQKQLRALSSGRNIVFADKNETRGSLFCILHTPLWVKWQSYINRQSLWEESPEDIDLHDQISWCLQHLHQFFKDPRYELPSIHELLKFEVFTFEEENFLQRLPKLSGRRNKDLEWQIENSRVAHVPEHKLLILSEASLNACAEAAAKLLLFQNKRTETPHKWDFYQTAHMEALIYFLSKTLNHSRKTKTWTEIKNAKTESFSKTEKKAVLSARSFYQHFDQRFDFLKAGRFRKEAAWTLGRILAERAFEAFLAGELSKQRLLRLLTRKMPSRTEAFEALVEWQAVGRDFRD